MSEFDEKEFHTEFNGSAFFSSPQHVTIADLFPMNPSTEVQPPLLREMNFSDFYNAITGEAMPIELSQVGSSKNLQQLPPPQDASSALCRRKQPEKWTKEEHRLFLLGLNTHGNGHWKDISRNFVRTKTPGQIASHAQKYFIRQSASPTKKKRKSIHDLTLQDTN
ncbi:hypothetical protein VNO78_35016 [Psophocarpus tetragonolobus]|uniref:Uncharacterized protein n=1 Tax=Psophocarpus tetragonolobus TaxID=3891 RepID=A0AAN9NSF2_PSOTE